jgi:hypothetical protein
MKSYITPDTKCADALWLIVERGKQSPEIEAIMGMFRDEDTSENVAYAIRKDEVKYIMQACIDYLTKLERKTD